jgi:PAS domain S-box-containing protein
MFGKRLLSMAPQRFEDVLLGEITKLRLENLNLNKEKTLLELLVETDAKHAEKINDALVAKLDKSKQELFEMIDHLRKEVIVLRGELGNIKREKQDLEIILEIITEHADDLTESLQDEIEATHLENKNRFQLISEAIPVPIVVNRVDNNAIIYANTPAAILLGVSKEALLNQRITDFYDPASRQSLSEEFAVSQTVSSFEIKGKTIDEVPFWSVLFTRQMSYDNAPCLLNVLYDLTDRKRIEKERKRLSLAIEHCAEGVVITDSQGNVQYINPAFERITGYFRMEFVGQNMRILKSGRHDKTFYDNIQKAIQEKNVWGGRIVNRKKDGNLYEAEVRISPIFDETGAIVNFVAVHRDVTYEVMLEDQLRHAQKIEAVGTLASGIAHDFNNILSAVLGFSELALLKTQGDPKLTHYIAEINKAGERAKALVKQILTFSRKTTQEKRMLHMSIIAKEAMKMLRSTIPTTIEIKQKIDCDGTILGDPAQIHQVIMNLCTNAYQAMRETGGTLTIELKEIEIDRNSQRRNRMLDPGKYVVLETTDTGLGMDKETIDKIFEPYFTTKRLEGGTGLGLSVVHGIVEAHQGHISVSSEPDGGTSFQVYLPLAEKEEEETALRLTSKAMPALEGMDTIMFVDDEEKIVNMASDYFIYHGYTIATFGNSVAALQEFEKHPHRYDMVVTDMTMPYLNGMELAVRLMEIRPSIPIILCTGHSELIDRERATAMGIRGFLDKPVAMNHLLREVRTILDE